jgi:hypothetical protein
MFILRIHRSEYGLFILFIYHWIIHLYCRKFLGIEQLFMIEPFQGIHILNNKAV